MLIDKGYYDYDYSEEARVKQEQQANMRTPKSVDEQQKQFKRFGFGKVRGKAQTVKLTPEEAQRIAMEEVKKKKQGE